ncbi:glycosyltransferase family 4 protein [Cellvibrio japonicus]|uniref:Glycosyl transferase, putative, gt4J n=1 Tax=Cellvibrio japonicus (strain Ueda107) TaxID=498211 RepID=B3PJL4_CELJU|nr:glycosyltransferase family 4 protein [Cellvibrio japonicus]ACE86289.1 glycosyl transferase, putative, gt4J [Cellvibrio japonicus Ueda107]QEI11298.1 glycosyltransferase family 4 protein [Cellvibrio japonicus]QEI14872.1 glycosyltransferase family 4 protein [Cellvibrio japonicus]QEI18452.1 glycosyltransferase family 4 protein [Cellvibrio japonicus]
MARVIHVVRQYLPSVGGMEEVVRNIARYQTQRGLGSTRIITLDRLFRNSREHLPAREIIEGIEVIRLPYKGSSRYPLCPSVLRHLQDADVVHVHGVDFFYDFLAATRWLHRRPLLLSTHGGFFHTRFASRAKQVYFKSITRLSGHAYERVVATSANDGQLFRQILPEDKLEVIENGVDVDKYADQSSPERRKTLVYFGRWSSNKGLLSALDLFAALHRQDNEWRLIITGREYDHSDKELRHYAATLQLDDAVTLVPNPDDNQIRELLHQASYFLCLSRHEGFGIAPIEAMSAGLTPILSEIPPFRRLVDESRLGFIAPADGQGFISQLQALHAQGEDAYRQRRLAAMAFARRYAWPAVAERYLALYRQLARGAA